MSDTGRARKEASTFLRFCVVGGVGFLVDAGVLAALTHALQVGPVLARCVSAPTAILVTFVLNRFWAFDSAKEAPLAEAFLAYCAVQGVGFGLNFLIYTALVSLPLGPFSKPLIALAIASGLALVFNFIGIRFFAFAPRRRKAG